MEEAACYTGTNTSPRKPVFSNKDREAVTIDWLHQVCCGTHFHAFQVTIYDAENDYWNRGKFRIPLQFLQDPPTIMVHHHDVKRNKDGLQLLGKSQSLLAASTGCDMIAEL